jgi:O-antigen/teichoic acid export membrane protein
MFLGYGLRIGVQAVYFVLIARDLGPGEYGAFVGVVSLAAIVSPFASLGSGNLLIKNVVRDPRTFPECWGNAILMCCASGLFLLTTVIAIARFWLPPNIGWSLILMVCIADLLLARIADVAGQAFQAMNQMRYTAALNLLPSTLRLVTAAYILLAWHHATAANWAAFYLGGTLLSSTFAVILTNWKLGMPKIALCRIREELAEGFYFGASQSAQTVYNDIDKTMLVRLSSLDATGIYAAAYRIIEVAFTPVRAVLNGAYPEFFRHGQHGVAASYAYAKRLLPKLIGYSVTIFALICIMAPVLPLVLGDEYVKAVEALRWLAVLPLLKTVHYFIADALTGAGHQRVRTASQIMVALLNVGLNLWLIPAYSWRGAAWASILSDGALAVTLYVALTLIKVRSETPAAALEAKQA